MQYEYKCDGCGATIELQRPLVNRNDEAKCGHCGILMRRIFSPVRSNFAPWCDHERTMIRDAVTP